jgi:beta-N-acetylhexosaminidase
MKKLLFTILPYLPKTLLFLPLFFVYGISSAPKPITVHKAALMENPPFLAYESQWVDSVFHAMTIDEKIGQLFMVPAYSNKGSEHKKSVEQLIEKYHVGGIIFFQGGPVRQAQMNNYFQEKSKIPLMIAGDYEWGLSMRLDSTVHYPRQMLMGAIQDNRLIYEFGKETARQLKRLGIHINFAPVIDVNNNPANPVINSRSFGENKYNVTRKGLMYTLGMQDHKILATGKHFPGHGDTDTDSHHELPVITHDKQRIDSIEAYPFRELIQNGLGGIMVAHLNIPALDAEKNSVSSLSHKTIHQYLKTELGFEGLIFTDALGMQGVAKHYKPGETELKSFQAGTDVLLMPQSVPAAFSAIKKGLADGLITESQLNRRVKKILKAKKWFGLDEYQAVETKNLINDLNTEEAQLLNRKLTEAAITIASDNYGLIPFSLPEEKKAASISLGSGKTNSFQHRLSNYNRVPAYAVFKDVSAKVLDDYLKSLKAYDFVFVSIHNTNRRPPYFGVNPNAFKFIDKLSEKTNVILSIFGNPYILKHITHPEKLAAVTVSYNDRSISRDLTAQAIFGGIKANGRLPVSAGKYFKEGSGETTKKIRLKYSEPAELKIRQEKLKKIDSVMQRAINDKATPGGVIIGAKNGTVFYRKAFGTHTYAKIQQTHVSDLYDLASLTKILATIPSLMKLYEEGKFNPKKNLGHYLDDVKGTNKNNLKIIDILTHQARLQSWIPFYIHTLNEDKTAYLEGVYAHKKNKKYSVEVARNLYILATYEDSMYQKIYDSELRKRSGYRYSDLGFYMLKKIIEQETGMSIKEYTRKNFYEPLGAYTLGYHPLENFPPNQIAPTENDIYYRKQLLRGYVHDYGAAMTGGVNGHAGLFANADDVAKMMQMYLQKGSYGNRKYFSPKTIEYFTTPPHNVKKNRRALGFDRPQRPEKGPTAQVVSDKSFGHSGFTGTYAWADPEYDFVYVFLSNRIYPDIENNRLLNDNVRTKIQQLFYESFMEEQQLAEHKESGTLTEFIN